MGEFRLGTLVSNKGSGAKLTGDVTWEVINPTAKKATVNVTVDVYLDYSNYTYAFVNLSASAGPLSNYWSGEIDNDDNYATVINESFDVYFYGQTSVTTALDVSVVVNSTYFNGTITGRGTITAEAGDPDPNEILLIPGASTVQMGKKLILTIDSPIKTYKHNIYYTFGDQKDIPIATGLTGLNISHEWTVPEIAQYCNNATSGIAKITCETFNGTTNVANPTANVTLTVPDPSVPSVANSLMVAGSKNTVTTKMNDTNFTYKMWYQIGSFTHVVTESSKSASWSVTPGLTNVGAQIPNGSTGSGRMYMDTFNGTAKVGETQSCAFQIQIPENASTKPQISAMDIARITDLTGDLATLHIRGKTGIRVTTTAAGKYSASIVSYTITAGSVKAQGNPATISKLADAGEVSVVVTVEDSRHFKNTMEQTITVLPYNSPKVVPYGKESSIVCERANSAGVPTADGAYLLLKAGKSWSSFVVNGTERNRCRLRYRYRPINGEFGDWITLLDYSSTATSVSRTLSNVVPDKYQAYVVEISAIDTIGGEDGAHIDSHNIMTDLVSFVLYDGPTGAGFGMYPSGPGVVEIAANLDLLVHGKLIVDGADFIDLVLMDNVYEATEAVGRYDGVGYAVKEGNHVYVAFSTSFSYDFNTVIMNSTPIPLANRPPRKVYSICPVDAQRIALVSVGTDGYIRVEWVLALGPAIQSDAVMWVDGYLDYWT